MNAEISPDPPPAVGLIADPTLPAAAEILSLVASELGRFVLGAEFPPTLSGDAAREYARHAAGRGLRALVVASAGSSFAGEVAAETPLPVLRVPVAGEIASGDSPLDLLWPEMDDGELLGGGGRGGIHATLAIGEAGARNAALFLVSMLALTDHQLQGRWREFRWAQTQAVLASTLPPV